MAFLICSMKFYEKHKKGGFMGQNEIKLSRIVYNESSLVDKICTEAQRKTYHKKERFTGGSTQKAFWDKLSCYCDYDYDPQTKKYKIIDIFEYPKTVAEAKIHKGIYQYLTPMMLNELLFGKESKDRRLVFTALDLAKTIAMVNNNYNTVKYHQDEAHIDLGFSKTVLSEYFNKADNRIDDYIRRCIKYLQTMNCIIYNEVHMIGFLQKEFPLEDGRIVVEENRVVRVATKDEMDLYSRIVEEASNRAKIKNNDEKWYGKKAAKYNAELTKLLNKHGIEFVCRAFEIYKVDEKRCKEILKSFADKTLEQRKYEVGYVLSAMMDTNAEIRLIKNPSLGNDYLDQFKRLSDIVMIADAPNILPMMPSINNNPQDRLKKKYGYEIEYRVRRKDNETE